jgi:hypothetical protein
MKTKSTSLSKREFDTQEKFVRPSVRKVIIECEKCGKEGHIYFTNQEIWSNQNKPAKTFVYENETYKIVTVPPEYKKAAGLDYNREWGLDQKHTEALLKKLDDLTHQ